MGEYSYEIIGGILIVLSSLVGEQMKPQWKVRSYLIFTAIAIGFSGIGIYLRWEAKGKEATERQERKEEIKSLKQDMSNMLKVYNGLGVSIAFLNADVAGIQKSLESAKGNPDPQRIADLVAKANAAQQRVNAVTKSMFVALVPGTAIQLRSFRGDWSTPEGHALIANARYVQEGLLEAMEATPDDKAAATKFRNEQKPRAWDPEQTARDLESLAATTKLPFPAQNLTATTQ